MQKLERDCELPQFPVLGPAKVGQKRWSQLQSEFRQREEQRARQEERRRQPGVEKGSADMQRQLSQRRRDHPNRNHVRGEQQSRLPLRRDGGPRSQMAGRNRRVRRKKSQTMHGRGTQPPAEAELEGVLREKHRSVECRQSSRSIQKAIKTVANLVSRRPTPKACPNPSLSMIGLGSRAWMGWMYPIA